MSDTDIVTRLDWFADDSRTASDAEMYRAAAAHIRRLRSLNAELVATLSALRSYTASVWFDEAIATDEERDLMARTSAALSRATKESDNG